jgi:uncharacterized protein YdgA (DUF945 family)
MIAAFVPASPAMKKLGLVVVVLAVLALGSPLLLGFIARSQVEARVAGFSDPDRALTVEYYERGWFRSRAKIALRLAPEYAARLAASTGASAQALEQGATLAVDIEHGPIAFGDGGRFGLASTVAGLDTTEPAIAALQRQLGVPYLFRFRAHTAFTGAVEFAADVPPLHAPLGGGAMLEFAGAALDGAWRGGRLTATAQAASLELSSPAGAFKFENLRATTDTEIRSRYVAPGTTHLSLQRAAVVDRVRGDGRSFQLEGLRADGSTRVDEHGRLEAQLDYSLASLRGAALELAGATASITVANLDPTGLEEYAAAAQAASPALDRDATLQALTPPLERLLRAGPTVTIDPLRFMLDGEAFDARVTIGTDPVKAADATLDLTAPETVLALIRGDAHVSISKKLAQRLGIQLTQGRLEADGGLEPEQAQSLAEAQVGLILVSLVGQGLLVDDGERYTTALTIGDGAATINGKALPLGLL